MDENAWLRPFDVGAMLRAVRHRARYTQRELASAASTTQRHIVRLENGAAAPSLALLVRLFAAMDCRLSVRDESGCELRPLEFDDVYDGAGRHYPAAVDLRPTGGYGGWWLDRAPLADVMPRPDWTYDGRKRLGRKARLARAEQLARDPPRM